MTKNKVDNKISTSEDLILSEVCETYHTYYENVYKENCENVHRCPICNDVLSVLLKRCMNPQCSDYGVVL